MQHCPWALAWSYLIFVISYTNAIRGNCTLASVCVWNLTILWKSSNLRSNSKNYTWLHLFTLLFDATLDIFIYRPLAICDNYLPRHPVSTEIQCRIISPLVPKKCPTFGEKGKLLMKSLSNIRLPYPNNQIKRWPIPYVLGKIGFLFSRYIFDK